MIKNKTFILRSLHCRNAESPTVRKERPVFGYIKTVPAELRLREHECYRAYYCGLCRAMGKCTGSCSRLTLSYDFVFLAVVRAWLCDEKPELAHIRCALHPFKRRHAVRNSPTLAYCANASVLLSYHKCLDDLADERGARKWRARLARFGLRGGYRKAKAQEPELDRVIRDRLHALAEYEKRPGTHSADEPASLFGDLMAAVFSAGLTESKARLAAHFGRQIGIWIYLTDAADDYAEDLRRGRYNPYAGLFGAEMTDADRRAIQLSLTEHLADAEQALQLFPQPPCPELRELASNVLYLGMPRTVEQILFPSQATKKEINHE